MSEYAVKFLAGLIVLCVPAALALSLFAAKMECDDSIVNLYRQVRVDYRSSAAKAAETNMQATCKAAEAQGRLIAR